MQSFQNCLQTTEMTLNTSINSKSSLLLSTYQVELDKKIMSYKNKEPKKSKKEVSTNYTKALKQYLRKKKVEKENQDIRDVTNTYGRVNTISKKAGFEVPSFLMISKNSKSSKYNKAAVKIQKYVRGWFVRRVDFLNLLRSYHFRRYFAARTIQRTWRRYVDYCNEIDDIMPRELNQKPYSPDHELTQTQIQRQKEKLGLVDYNHMPAISNRSRKLAEKRRRDMGLGNLTVEDALIQENRIRTSNKQK